MIAVLTKIRISAYRNKVKIYNQDIFSFLKWYLPQAGKNRDMFVYFDPPYYEKGHRLYMNCFSSKDHERLRDAVSQLNCKWIMTYDDKAEIKELYQHYQKLRFFINYSLSNKKKGGELMIFKDTSCIPSFAVIDKLSKAVVFDNLYLEGIE